MLCSEGGDAVLVADDGEQVVAKGVCHVLGEVGIGPLPSHVALHGESLWPVYRRQARDLVKLEDSNIECAEAAVGSVLNPTLHCLHTMEDTQSLCV